MSNIGVYGQIATFGIGVGWDDENGFVLSVFGQASIGISGSVWGSVYFDPRDADYGATHSEYVGVGTPFGTPVVAMQYQKNVSSGDEFVTFGLGLENTVEVGIYWEGGSTQPHTVIMTDRRYEDEGVLIVSDSKIALNGNVGTIVYATDLDGNKLAPIDAKPYLEEMGYHIGSGGLVYIYQEQYEGAWVSPGHCFPAGTLIAMADGSRKAIEDIAVGDMVLSFNEQGDLVPAPVTQLLDNVTTEWLKLSNGTVVTLGHRYLRPDGSFAEIKEIIADDGRIVAEDGEVMTVTAEAIHYSSNTAHMFEQHEKLVSATSGATALAPEVKTGWRTYNFTVGGTHTYIADGAQKAA